MADIFLKKLSMMILFDNWTVRQMMIYQYFLNQCKNFYQFFNKTTYITEIMKKKLFQNYKKMSMLLG